MRVGFGVLLCPRRRFSGAAPLENSIIGHPTIVPRESIVGLRSDFSPENDAWGFGSGRAFFSERRVSIVEGLM